MCVESIVTAVVDMYPKVFRRGYRRELLILGLSIVSYFIGLIMLTEVRCALLYYCREEENGFIITRDKTRMFAIDKLHCQQYDYKILETVLDYRVTFEIWNGSSLFQLNLGNTVIEVM